MTHIDLTECPRCNGTGQVLQNGTNTFPCPTCDGKGTVPRVRW